MRFAICQLAAKPEKGQGICKFVQEVEDVGYPGDDVDSFDRQETVPRPIGAFGDDSG